MGKTQVQFAGATLLTRSKQWERRKLKKSCCFFLVSYNTYFGCSKMYRGIMQAVQSSQCAPLDKIRCLYYSDRVEAGIFFPALTWEKKDCNWNSSLEKTASWFSSSLLLFCFSPETLKLAVLSSLFLFSLYSKVCKVENELRSYFAV